MSTRRVILYGSLLALALTALQASPGRPPSAHPPGPPVPGMTYDLTQLAPGVYVAIAHGVPYYVANSVVIIGDDGVLLVDSGAGTHEAHVLRAAIRTITSLPVRDIVDTHVHFDHALGHAAFPDAVTIGHVATRAGLALGQRQPTLAANLQGMPARAAELRAKAEAETDSEKRAALLEEAATLDAYRQQLAAHVPSPSRLTFTAQLTVWLGNREVRVILWRQAEHLKSAGLSAQEAAARIDLRVHSARFPQFAKPGFSQPAIERIYDVIDERAAGVR